MTKGGLITEMRMSEHRKKGCARTSPVSMEAMMMGEGEREGERAREQCRASAVDGCGMGEEEWRRRRKVRWRRRGEEKRREKATARTNQQQQQTATTATLCTAKLSLSSFRLNPTLQIANDDFWPVEEQQSRTTKGDRRPPLPSVYGLLCTLPDRDTFAIL